MSEFSTEGFAPFPNIWADNQRTGEFLDWTTEALQDKSAEYTKFLETDPMPRAKEGAKRIISHTLFELVSRLKEDGIPTR